MCVYKLSENNKKNINWLKSYKLTIDIISLIQLYSYYCGLQYNHKETYAQSE